MRDIFHDIYQQEPVDPMESARRGSRAIAKRFFKTVGVGEADGAFRILLDGKPVRTPARRILAAPSRALADGLVAEWDAQKEVIDPALMPLTRLCNSIIDGVSDSVPAVTDDIVKYLGSDLVFYRADGPEGLIESQAQHWDPMIDFARDALGARFILAQGVIFVTQPEEAIAAARQALPDNAWTLGALHSLTSIAGSPLIALAMLRGALSPDAAWRAAHVDEDWNIQAWGHDELATKRRAFRRAEFDAAARVLALAGEKNKLRVEPQASVLRQSRALEWALGRLRP